MNEMTERQESNLVQQIENIENRTIVRPTTFVHICYLTWQEWADSTKTLDDDGLKKIDVHELRKLLDKPMLDEPSG